MACQTILPSSVCAKYQLPHEDCSYRHKLRPRLSSLKVSYNDGSHTNRYHCCNKVFCFSSICTAFGFLFIWREILKWSIPKDISFLSWIGLPFWIHIFLITEGTIFSFMTDIDSKRHFVCYLLSPLFYLLTQFNQERSLGFFCCSRVISSQKHFYV